MFSRRETFLKLSYCGLLAAGLLAMGRPLAAQSRTYSNITGYTVPYLVEPTALTTGPDGDVWFTYYSGDDDNNPDGLVRMTVDGTTTQYYLDYYSQPNSITTGSDGAIWFTYENSIGRITTGGAMTSYGLPTAGSAPGSIVSGSDGALWFTESESSKIGRLTTGGSLTEYGLTTSPGNMALGSDGALWFTEQSGKIGRITIAGAITEFPLAPQITPWSIAAGPDGALWFTEFLSTGGPNQIGRITTSGSLTAYPLPSNFEPGVITSVADGALWLTQTNSPNLARMTTQGTLTEFAAAGSGTLSGIMSGPGGDLWFGIANPGSIAKAPACALGFSAKVSQGTLAMTFNLGIDTPATFEVILRNAAGVPIGPPHTQRLSPVVPPQHFTIYTQVPDLGEVTVLPMLLQGPGQPICAEWAVVNTAN